MLSSRLFALVVVAAGLATIVRCSDEIVEVPAAEPFFGPEECRSDSPRDRVTSLSERREGIASTGGGVIPHSPRISGRVVTTGGKPLASCSISCGHKKTSTDTHGRFTFVGLPPGEYRIQASAAGCAQLPTPPVRAGLGDRLDLIVEMETARFLFGRVLSADGRALSGARINLRVTRCALRPDWRPIQNSPSMDSFAETDAQGAFRIGPLLSGECTIDVRHPAHFGFARRMPTGSSHVEIRLHPLGLAMGRVTSANTGNPLPIERLSVLVSRDDERGPWQFLPESAWHASSGLETGRFRVHVRTRRFVKVIAHSATCAPVTSPPFRIGRGQVTRPMVLKAIAGTSIRGRVLDNRGQPITGAEITVLNGGDADAPRIVVSKSYSGSDGNFVTSPLRGGPCVLRVGHVDYLTEAVEQVVGPSSSAEDDLRICLPPAGRIVGFVVAPAIGALPELWVVARPLGKKAWVVPVVAVRNRKFGFSGLEPGRYRLELRGEDANENCNRDPLAIANLHVRGLKSSTVSLDIRESGEDLFGVLACAGQPRPGVEVVLESEDRALTWRCTTDATGKFHFAALPTGDFRIMHADGSDSGQRVNIEANTEPTFYQLDYGRDGP